VNATVEDAVRLGADAVGYTLYVGSPAKEQDFTQLRRVREDAVRLGMPLIVWSYPRGSSVGVPQEYVRDISPQQAIDAVVTSAGGLGAGVALIAVPVCHGAGRSDHGAEDAAR
jgi:fructose-bisphosphate aldolase, class I